MVIHGGILATGGDLTISRAISRFRRGIELRAASSAEHQSISSYAVAGSYSATRSRVRSALFVDGDDAVVTLDGRLDNRDDLLRRLDLDGKVSDAELFYRCYGALGTGCFATVVGDWAVTINCIKSNEVLLAKDYAGVRPLDYCCKPGLVAWSSELEPLLTLFGVPSFDHEYLLGFLESHPPLGRSPYSTIHSVPPGCLVRIRNAQTRIERYYQFALHESSESTSDADWEERFRYFFRRAIADRINVPGEIWAELSGGMDSTSIVFQTCEILKSDPARGPVRTISYTFRENSTSNEDAYIAVAERALGSAIAPRHVYEDEFELLTTVACSRIPLRPQAGAGRPHLVGKMIAPSNAGVLLSGQGGDAIMWSEFRPCLPIADRIWRGDFRGLLGFALEHSIFVQSTVWDLLWNDGLRRRLRPSMSDSISAERRGIDPWLRWDRLDRLFRPSHLQLAAELKGKSPGAIESLRRVAYMIQVFGNHFFRSSGPTPVAYPFSDRRLVEFMLTVPSEQKLRPTETRSLHRRALRKLLPPEISFRESKGPGSGAVVRAIRREWPVLKHWFNQDCRLASHGLIDLKLFRQATDEVLQRRRSDIFSFMRAVSLEGWLRQMESWRISDTIPHFGALDAS